MADILLLQPKVSETEPWYAPTALMCLASYIEPEFSVRIIDSRTNPNYKRDILEALDTSPILVGVSSMTGMQIKYGLELSKIVKEYNPRIPVVWGGVHPTYFPEQTLENPYIDFVIRFQGEEPLLQLARALSSNKHTELKNIRGLVYKEDGRCIINPKMENIDLSSYPPPAWYLVDVQKYIANLSKTTPYGITLDIISSRGCVYRCKFCYAMSFYERKWYARKVDSVVEEIIQLHHKYGANHFMIHDDIFIINKATHKRAVEIFKRVNQNGRGITFSINLRVDQFRRNLLAELVDWGLVQIRAGVESGSERVLQSMTKDITTEQILDSARMAKELGFAINYSFVIGWPGETEEDRYKTITMCLRLQDSNPNITIYPLWIYIPYPGTPYYDESIKLGFKPPALLEEWGDYYWGKVLVPWMSNTSKIQDIHTLSKFVFSTSGNVKKMGASLIQKGVPLSVKLRRIFALPVSCWARFRFRHSFWVFPYEYKILDYMLRGI